ncbi:MAG TPA: serine hydrolase domain-containing protein [Vicinamibacterales bacterium]|nr:serine hydrolase domain-containing protein [Vicinamibacterales bacterium]
MKVLSLLLLFALACPPHAASAQAQPAPVQTQVAPGPVPQSPALEFKELAEDTKVTSASGATFTVNKGWHLARTDSMIVIQEPQRELAAAFVELTAPSGEEAIAQAWRRWRPDFARTVRMTSKPPPTEGWEEIAQITYETGAEERRVVVGIARRKGATYYVTLVDGVIAAMQRRSAQLNTAIASLEVAGRAEENLAGKKAHALEGARAETFLAFAEAARKQMGVPGAAIAVVQGGRIVLEKGLGVRELGKNEAVTPATLFMIGSMTKPLSSLLMARLVDRGTFSWDTPVTKLFPSFALGDPEATRRVTMAHTVCACTGLPRWDMEFIFEWEKTTPQSRIELLRAMKPTTGFGETFQYSNLMVASGGYVAAMSAAGEKDLRRAYVEAMNAEVLGPVGMKSTVLDLDAARTREHARPHARTLKFEPAAIAVDIERGVDSVMPAGGAWSSVRDISRWLLLELQKGTLDGKQVVSETALLERRRPRVKVSAKQSYGLALFIDESRGLLAIGHGGNTFGFTADATFYPGHGLGLVVLTNAAASNAYTGAVRRRLIELLFDANEEAEKGLAFSIKQRDEGIRKNLAEITTTPDPALIEPILGRWTNPRLGAIEFRREADGFVFDAGEWRSPVGEHKDQSGVRRVILTGPPFAGLAFWPRENEGRPALLFETAQQKYWFERPGPATR